MTPDRAALAAWNRANARARAAYHARCPRCDRPHHGLCDRCARAERKAQILADSPTRRLIEG